MRFALPCVVSGSGELGRETGKLSRGAGQRERRMTRGTARLGKWVNGLADQVGVGPAR
jgi:hypothetical protein